ncbi:SAM-dependent methyltransferase [uncultured Desulfatiglans sp.]|uniref:SAM-dependent methyltransferase n=1 Tax=Uncultured Desulfatiglans sp. TaxID=1748965 RepID=A0A653AED0_UNCDX|nr:SAM-dependent methyltransferase [uncultured Desulfatiglans sp.]
MNATSERLRAAGDPVMPRDPGSPHPLLIAHADLFTSERFHGRVLDVACGDGRNGIFLARLGVQVTLCDVSKGMLEKARRSAAEAGVDVEFWEVDLEKAGENPLDGQHYGGILVFRYLHRPLIPCLRKSLLEGGILIYSTFTTAQRLLGRPRNPDHLLNPGELLGWFEDWEVIHSWEGIRPDPDRAMAEIICRKRTIDAP